MSKKLPSYKPELKPVYIGRILHARYKAACVKYGAKMGYNTESLIDQWITRQDARSRLKPYELAELERNEK